MTARNGHTRSRDDLPAMGDGGFDRDKIIEAMSDEPVIIGDDTQQTLDDEAEREAELTRTRASIAVVEQCLDDIERKPTELVNTRITKIGQALKLIPNRRAIHPGNISMYDFLDQMHGDMIKDSGKAFLSGQKEMYESILTDLRATESRLEVTDEY